MLAIKRVKHTFPKSLWLTTHPRLATSHLHQ